MLIGYSIYVLLSILDKIMASIESFALSPYVIAKLKNADFLKSTDIIKLKPTELSSATSLSLKECTEVLRLISSGLSKPLSLNAMNLQQLMEQEEDVGHIVTFCESLDELLGGGIPLRTITEISGTPGIGKTQMCMQACVSVQLPHQCGGVDGEAIYIDTEGSFSVVRLKEMSIWAEKHVKQMLEMEERKNENNDFEKLLKGIYYFRCQNYLELLAVVKNLPDFIEEHSKVKLIVIDSIAFHFRHDFHDMMTRTSLLCSMTQDLIKQATKYRLGVIVTNQMTTKVKSDGNGELVTALGETWGHCPTLRLCLFWNGVFRSAKLIKSPHMKNSTIQFQITSGGIRDKKKEPKRKLDE